MIVYLEYKIMLDPHKNSLLQLRKKKYSSRHLMESF